MEWNVFGWVAAAGAILTFVSTLSIGLFDRSTSPRAQLLPNYGINVGAVAIVTGLVGFFAAQLI